ncbi:MAG: CocE/NonD family hydrolase [Pseudomonadota bacterium]
MTPLLTRLFPCLMLVVTIACVDSGAITRPTDEQGLDPLTDQHHETVTRNDILIPMRDGVRLLADITLPKGDGPWPTILVRTPYGRHFESHGSFGERGYAYVIQATRGRNGSEGTWGAWEDDRDDGYDTIDWIAKQSWSNGNVGMRGGSYSGQAQILAASAGHPALKCVVPVSPGSDGFSDYPFRGGVPMLSLVPYFYVMRGPVLDTSGELPQTATDANLKVLPLSDVDQAWSGQQQPIWDRFTTVTRASDMPSLDIWDEFHQLDTPIAGLHIGGRWDNELMATRKNFSEFSRKWPPHQYLVFGPWPHNPNQSTSYADVAYGPMAKIRMGELIQRFYASCLKGRNVGMDQIPKVQVFATGMNDWLALSAWPAPEAEPVSFHMTASRTSGRGRLMSTPAANETSVHWTHDPEQAIGGRDLWFERSTRLWFDTIEGDNVQFMTAPFASDMLLTGPATLDLWVSTSAQDTDLFAVITEMTADGEVRALHQTAPFRMRYRDGYNNPSEMPENVPQRVTINLADFAHLFKAGSRLGLAIRSELFPAAARNLGTMEPYDTGTTIVVQHNTIHMGVDTPSRLTLYELRTE